VLTTSNGSKAGKAREAVGTREAGKQRGQEKQGKRWKQRRPRQGKQKR
jgi:hypothetical protein